MDLLTTDNTQFHLFTCLHLSLASNDVCFSSDWQSTVDKLIKKTNLALVIGTHSWREQFVEAVTVSAGELCVCVCGGDILLERMT